MKITKDNINEILDEVQKDSYEIPFGNSQYQTEKFVVNASLTSERAYRNILLRLKDRITAMKENSFNVRLLDNKMEKYNHKISILEKHIKRIESEIFNLNRNNIDVNDKHFDLSGIKIEIERLQIKMDKIMSSKEDTDKLANDALHEIEYLYNMYKKLPKYSREDFENAEEDYFKISLQDQARGMVGAQASLGNMGFSLDEQGRLIDMKKHTKRISEEISEGNLLEE